MGRICFAVLLLFSGMAYANPPRYTVHELPELAGADIQLMKMNDAGDIVGQVRLPDNSWRGFLYANGDYADFGDLIGDGLSYLPRAFNNLGQVVLYRSGQYWLYTDGELELLPFGSGDEVSAMNDHGAIVGEIRVLGENSLGNPKYYREAFIYRDGQLTLILEPPVYADAEEDVIVSGGFGEFRESRASDINNAGVVVGVLTGHIDGPYQDWFRYYDSDGSLYSMSALDDTMIAPTLNNSGQIVGSGIYDYVSGISYQDGTRQWFLEAPFGVHSDPLLGTFYAWDARVYDVNDNGDSVATFEGHWSEDEPTEVAFGALIDSAGEPFVLIQQLVPDSGWDTISGASRINNNGWILAKGTRYGLNVPVLLKPVPPKVVFMNVNPWDSLNRVNPNSTGKLSVLLGGTSTALGDAVDFDATQIDPATLRFGLGSAPNVLGPWLVDVDADTLTDALVAFDIQEAGIFCGDTSLSVAGETYSGEQFIGTDAIQTVDCVDGCHL